MRLNDRTISEIEQTAAAVLVYVELQTLRRTSFDPLNAVEW